MYESHFQLRIKPFELLPNPEFIFSSKSHKRTMTFLDYGIKERSGFILLTGEIGSGKTTIIRDLTNKYQNSILLSKVFNTNVDSHQLLSLINEDFGLGVQGKDKQTLFRELTDFLIAQYAKGNQPVLIIDEAQNLDVEKLEEIRLLSNLENENAKLLQIILVGQPELRKTLASPKLLQLRQRININCHLKPLNRNEIAEYILHRLEVAGNRNAIAFLPEAFDEIFRASRGIPRLVNIICDFIMLSAFAEQKDSVDGEMVLDIIADLDFENHFWGEPEKGEKPVSAARIYRGYDPEVQELKAALFDVSHRLEVLEKQENHIDGGKIRAHFERFARMIADYAQRTAEEITCLKNELQEVKRTRAAILPLDEGAVKEKGLGVTQGAA